MIIVFILIRAECKIPSSPEGVAAAGKPSPGTRANGQQPHRGASNLCAMLLYVDVWHCRCTLRSFAVTHDFGWSSCCTELAGHVVQCAAVGQRLMICGWVDSCAWHTEANRSGPQTQNDPAVVSRNLRL